MADIPRLLIALVAFSAIGWLCVWAVLAISRGVRKATLEEVARYLERNAESQRIAKNTETSAALKTAALYVRDDSFNGAFLHLSRRVHGGEE